MNADGHAGAAADHRGDPALPPRARQRRVLWIVLAASGVFMVVEVVGGIVFGSLALLADAAHMLSDVVGLAIAIVAHSLLERPATLRHSYGLQRSEVLGAQANGVLLLATAGWIVYEAVRRLGDVPEVDGTGLLVVASAGLAVNLVSAVALARVRGRSLNIRGAWLHMLADAAASVGVVAAGVAVVVAGANWVDPAVSIAIGLSVLWAAWRLLADTTHVLLEGTPGDLDLGAVEAAILGERGVEGVHHLHAWSLASDTTALSAHVVLEGEVDLHEAQERGEEVHRMLRARFGVAHATLELECHPCEPAGGGPDAHGPGARGAGPG